MQHPATDHANAISKREGESYLESGFKKLKNHDFAAAISDLEKASTLLPTDVRVYSRLGAAEFAQEGWKAAVDSYTKAIEQAPANDNDYLYFARGRAYEKLGQLDEAIADFNAAVQSNPRNAAAFVKLGDVRWDQQDRAGAIQAYSKAIEICAIEPDAYDAWNAAPLAGHRLHRPGKKSEAAADLAKASCAGSAGEYRGRSKRSRRHGHAGQNVCRGRTICRCGKMGRKIR